MRVLACLAALLLLTACSYSPAPKVEVLKPSYVEAVRALQIRNVPVVDETLEILRLMFARDGDEFVNICTVSHINREQHLWLTAAHCVKDIGEEGRYINGLPVEVVEADELRDLAVLKLPGYTGGRELPLQQQTPRWGQDIVVVGHPFGYHDVFITRGYIANPLVMLNGPYMVFDVAGAPGNSGSPVLNLQGELVSVLQIGWGRSFSPITGGAPYMPLKLFLSRYLPAPISLDDSGILVLNPF